MGEQTEYRLNGDDCQGCGEHLGKGPGYPRWCADCAPSDQRQEPIYRSKREKRAAKRRRQRQRRAAAGKAELTLQLITTLRAQGWRRCSQYHWQLRTPMGLVDFWPTTKKWAMGGEVHRGSFADVAAALAARQKEGA